MFALRIFRSFSSRLIAWGAASVLLGTNIGTAANDDSLGHAVLRYRMQVYESYRLNRPELDRHLQAGYALISAWRDRGSPLDEVDELMDWFQRSTWAVRTSRSLPEYEYAVAEITSVPPGDSAQAQPAQAPTIRSTRDAAARRVPHDTGNATSNSDRSALPAPSPSAVSRAAGVPEPRRRPALPDAAPDDLPPLNPADIVPDRPVENSTFVADQLPRVRLHLAPPRDAFRQSSPLSPAPATPLSPHHATSRGTPDADRRVDVNVQVLSARIRSTNLSLAAIEGELAASSTWTVEQLESITQDLARLLDGAELARLYYEALSNSQRREVESPMDDGPIRALLAQRLFETRIQLADQARTEPSAALAQQRDRLEALFEQIQHWDGDNVQ